MSIAQSLRKFRRRFNLTQAQVAEAAGITTRGYNNFEVETAERQAALPNIGVLIKISKAFNVSIDYLAGISNNPEINNKPSVNSLDDDTAENLSGNEFEAQVISELESLKRRISKLESRLKV